MRKKRLGQVTLGILLLLVLCAGLALKYAPDEMLAKMPGNPWNIPVTSTVPMAPADVQQLEQALNSADPQAQSVAMEPGFAAAFAAQPRPVGTQLSIVADSHMEQGAYGRVDAVVTAPDGQSATYHLYLTRDSQSGPWVIYQTEGA